jgi:lambda repressor-like predicted transcriptional regulator
VNRPACMKKGGRPRRDDITAGRVLALRERGLSLRQIARQLRAGYGTVRKALQTSGSATNPSENRKTETL